MKLTNFKHIAILNTAFLGDITLSLFLCKKIKDISPTTKITFLTTKAAAEILKLSKEIDSVIIFDKKDKHKKLKSVITLADELNVLDIDCFISTHKSFRSGIFLNRLKCIKICFNDASLSAFANYRVPYRVHLHEVKRQLSLLLPFAEFDESEIDNFNYPNLSTTKETIFSKPIICIAPGSVWKTKRWTTEGFAKVIDYFSSNYRVCLIGANNEEDIEIEISKASNVEFENLVGKLSFQETFQLISNSALLLSNDSAPTHFASTTNTKTLTIFGPTIPEFGFSPIAENSETISINLPCSPCHHHGLNTCPIQNHNCMVKLNPDNVIAKMEQLLANHSNNFS